MVAQEEVFQTRALLLEKVRDKLLARRVGLARVRHDVMFLVHFYAVLRPFGSSHKQLYSRIRQKSILATPYVSEDYNPQSALVRMQRESEECLET